MNELEVEMEELRQLVVAMVGSQLISQWLPCPLAIWAFGLDGKSC